MLCQYFRWVINKVPCLNTLAARGVHSSSWSNVVSVDMGLWTTEDDLEQQAGEATHLANVKSSPAMVSNPQSRAKTFCVFWKKKQKQKGLHLQEPKWQTSFKGLLADGKCEGFRTLTLDTCAGHWQYHLWRLWFGCQWFKVEIWRGSSLQMFHRWIGRGWDDDIQRRSTEGLSLDPLVKWEGLLSWRMCFWSCSKP